MSTQNAEAAKPINEMKMEEEVKSSHPHTQGQDSGQVGKPAAAKPARKPKEVNGTLVERQFKRRNNINSLPGLIREHARHIALMRTGEMPLDRGEVLSRAYARHKEMVSALEQRTQLAAIEQQLAALRGQPSQQLLIDEARAKRPGGGNVPRATDDEVKP
jgi:hypothetical protein